MLYKNKKQNELKSFRLCGNHGEFFRKFCERPLRNTLFAMLVLLAVACGSFLLIYSAAGFEPESDQDKIVRLAAESAEKDAEAKQKADKTIEAMKKMAYSRLIAFAHERDLKAEYNCEDVLFFLSTIRYDFDAIEDIGGYEGKLPQLFIEYLDKMKAVDDEIIKANSAYIDSCMEAAMEDSER